MLTSINTSLEKYGVIESVSLGDSIMGAPYSELFWPMAAEWPTELIPKDLREFQESDVEMLLVNGTVDFSTPPTTLDEAKPYLHKAQMVLLPEFSHVEDVYTLQPEALERLITSYYDTGVADDSLYVYQPRILGLLIDDLYDLNQPIVLVLDDYHLLTEAAILEAMEFLPHHQPRQFRCGASSSPKMGVLEPLSCHLANPTVHN